MIRDLDLVAVLLIGASSTGAMVAVGFVMWRVITAIESLTTEIKIMSPQVQKLQQDVAAMRDVNQSAVTLLQGLSQQLKDAIANAKDAGDMAALDALSTDLEQQTQALAGAITENTPAAPGT
jgi:hypothetical protein